MFCCLRSLNRCPQVCVRWRQQHVGWNEWCVGPGFQYIYPILLTSSTAYYLNVLGTWEWMNPVILGTAPESRFSHTAVVANNKLFIFGGILWVSGIISNRYNYRTTTNDVHSQADTETSYPAPVVLKTDGDGKPSNTKPKVPMIYDDTLYYICRMQR